ncbi:uncharacterized protein EAE97_009004 [Botrytis byssoidea]|uniref:DUF7730 domain-containing protein n=1 Tax=Botrytis byssoidea TaxID=139641 RepID=A0A9P5LNE9_9HELO|nr:uncharacterized protein EAE97_009004 [Botrytis byssoidea]KAF7931983.1 hypothetical protein EAE97_009004 [Botrytis byssoidea]
MAIFCSEIFKKWLPRRKLTSIASPDPLKTRSNSSVLTLPFPREIIEQGRETNAQSQSLLLSSLPTEIRMLIWKLCIGGDTFHLKAVCFGPQYRHTCLQHRLCDNHWNPAVPWQKHYPCLGDGPRYYGPRYYGKDKDKFNAFSLVVTCRQICSETIDIFYSSNAFRMSTSRAPDLPKILLSRRYNCIRVLYFEIGTAVTKAFVKDSKHRNETLKEWTDTWKVLADLSGLQILHVEICCWDLVWWTKLTDDQKSFFLQPIFSVTQLHEFEIYVPLDQPPPEDTIWSALPSLRLSPSWMFDNGPCYMLRDG